MTPAAWTTLFIAVTALVIGVYDLFAWWRWGVEATISDQVRAWGRRWPWLPWLVAAAGLFLWWHFFLQG